MIDTVYIEAEVASHPRTAAVRRRLPKARFIEIQSYRTLFNRRQQNFRVQKQRPALILAQKTHALLQPIPPHQDIGADRNYYFSHLLNCPFDCRYCFLQGMFRSANYVLFVNFEDFLAEIRATRCQEPGTIHFFSGYDCDSLALEPLSGFARYFIPAFEGLENCTLELRTKSTQIRTLLDYTPHPQCIVAMSLAPACVAADHEHGAPSLSARLDIAKRLQEHGWSIGLRFDPLLPTGDDRRVYAEFFQQVFDALDPDALHSVTIGEYRLPRDFAKRMLALYPEERLFARATQDRDGVIFLPSGSALVDQVNTLLRDYVDPNRIHRQHAAALDLA